MSSQTAQQTVAKILLELSKGEKSIEISRKILSDKPNFNIEQIFSYLDTDKKNRVDSIDIVNYLLSKNYPVTEKESQLVVLFYDQDYDGVLSFNEFKNLFQSENSIPKNSYNNISYDIDACIFEILQKEIELARKIIDLLYVLKNLTNFNIHEIYHLLKSNWIGITRESIRYFLINNDSYFSDTDLTSIIKRLDFNKDGRVDLCELHAFLGYPDCCFSCPCTACNFCGVCYCEYCFCNCHCYYHNKIHHSCHSPCSHNSRNNSPKTYENVSNNNYKIINPNESIEMQKSQNLINKNIENENMEKVYNDKNEIFNNKYNNYSPVNKKNLSPTKISNNLSLRLSPERKYGPEKCGCNACICKPCICSNNKYNSSAINKKVNNNFNNNNTCLYMQLNPKNKNDNENNFYGEVNKNTENQFINYIKEAMDCENEIEAFKSSLASVNDFNVEDAFRIFEFEGRGYLDKDDLKYGLNLLNVPATLNEINLLFKRFNIHSKGVIEYSDFFDVLVPFDKNIRFMVENRRPNTEFASRSLRCFSFCAINCLRNLFNTIINCENKLNEMKKHLMNVKLGLPKIFELIDARKKGYFEQEDLKVYLYMRGIFTNERDCDLLFIKLDKNRNGKIELYEVEDEIKPIY